MIRNMILVSLLLTAIRANSSENDLSSIKKTITYKREVPEDSFLYNNAFVYNAYAQNIKIGFILADSHNFYRNNYSEIGYLDIIDGYQKQGIGSQLLQYAIDDLKADGARGVLLNSTPTSVNFYKKFGFITLPDTGLWIVPMRLDF